ncbi:heterokaryon incompatibility Het-C [Microthyrium microscopicum]|uniref:Heterokaryon incompatibility Het-C n=1 Tax=Microthyrium microscopicum TaxID=703497 RepID=A0A6A6U710_9PEZI|nr:heterokaryon incompatibility Het-C [Microthyrium microscopicum]
MAFSKFTLFLLVALTVLILLPAPVSAFGAGNIASISKIEGRNWRHGDIEDTLEKIAFIAGRKFSSKLIKRVYFGNWLRDYSQAVDVGSLKGVQKDAIRIIVWVLAFMSFGYATEEFEVTEDRLGTYQAHEHIDNPKGYPDDAQKYDPRLRPPVRPEEIAIDINTGMKNYISNESGGWATSSDYIKWSITRSIHFGRLYTSGPNKGRDSDLYEALRCLGQALHTCEDFSAHSNYTELALREMGYHNVFAHVGTGTEITVRGKRIFPLTTGTFGGLDFVISVLGEAGDHMAQSEVDEVNTALYDAVAQNKKSTGPGSLEGLTGVLSKVPGTDGLINEARQLQQESDSQAQFNTSRAAPTQAQSFQGPPGSTGGPPGPGIPGMTMDPQQVIAKIYPILVFRDKVVRAVSDIISKVPGLESLLETISERITMFVMALIAPFVQPIIKAVTASLKTGNNAVIESSNATQYEVWNDARCSDPTHSMLSKDHFSNILNEPAGKIASEVVSYVAPRVVYGWEHPDVPVHEITDDVVRVFHHPALRDQNIDVHRRMYSVVETWARAYQGDLNNVLGSESVKQGRNHVGGQNPHTHGAAGTSSHSKVSNSPFEMFNKKRDMGFADDMGDSGYGSGATSQYGGQQQQQYGGQQEGYGSGYPQQHSKMIRMLIA